MARKPREDPQLRELRQLEEEANEPTGPPELATAAPREPGRELTRVFREPPRKAAERRAPGPAKRR